MKNLFVAQQGVRGCNVNVEKKGCITVSFADGKNSPYTAIEVNNYKGVGLTYRQRDEPLVVIHNLPDCGSDPVFAGTHPQLVEKLTYNPQSLLETLFQITYEMGFQKFDSGNTMADMMAAIEMAQRFEREHKDTDWDQEDWLSATSEFIEEEINKLKKEE